MLYAATLQKTAATAIDLFSFFPSAFWAARIVLQQGVHINVRGYRAPVLLHSCDCRRDRRGGCWPVTGDPWLRLAGGPVSGTLRSLLLCAAEARCGSTAELGLVVSATDVLPVVVGRRWPCTQRVVRWKEEEGGGGGKSWNS